MGACFKYQGLNTFKISFQENMWNENFRKSRVLPDKLVAIVIPDNLGNQNNFI